jgi:hypothetical protein
MNWQKILQEKPDPGSSEEEVRTWKERVKQARERQSAEDQIKIKASREQWNPEEWESMNRRLETLSLKQLQILATKLGVRFEGGIESVKDREVATAKQQIISVLDEVNREELTTEFERIVGHSNN